MDYEADVLRFVASAREYCAWVEKAPGPREVFEATRLLSRLFADAVVLPDVDHGYLSGENDIPAISQDERRRARERFRDFPFQYYWEIFHPVTAQPEEPVCGDISDDFLDIYCDVKSGLMAYDAELRPLAVWHWRFCWGVHWGDHAASAIKALESYKEDEGSS